MHEYYSEGVVLDIEPSGEVDIRAAVFMKHFGKLTGKLKSARKITSKLAGHVQPGNVVKARFVEKKGLQLVEALKTGRIAATRPDLYLLNKLLGEEEQDLPLWDILTAEGVFDWRGVLTLLGYDATHASCVMCGEGIPAYFGVEGQFFACEPCYIGSREKGAVVRV